MSVRSLVEPCRLKEIGSDGHLEQQTLENSKFRLQAPPLKRREKRQGRMFISNTSEDGKHSPPCPPPSPIFSAPRCWRRFNEEELEAPSSSSILSAHKKNEGQISPKDILAGDIRLVFPESYDSSLDEQIASGMKTPRASQCNQGATCLIEQVEETSTNKSSANSSVSTSTSLSHGTFGGIRKRSGTLQSRKSQMAEAHCEEDGDGQLAHTIIPLFPASPLTPQTMAGLHSPKADTSERGENSLAIPMSSAPPSVAPLSATLKRLGAARKSHTFPTAYEEDDDAFDSHSPLDVDIKCSRRLIKESLLRRGAEKEIHDARDAIKEAEILLRSDEDCASARDTSKAEHKQIAGLTSNPPQHARLAEPGNQPRIQSTARGVARRTSNAAWSHVQRMSTSLASYLFGNHLRARANELEVFYPSSEVIALQNSSRSEQLVRQLQAAKDTKAAPSAAPQSNSARGDGWGGLRPRSSWFPSITLGPLLSPIAAADNATFAARQLKTLQLNPDMCSGSGRQARRKRPFSDLGSDDWEDVEEVEHGAGSTVDTPSSPRNLRVRFPSYLPQPSKGKPPIFSKKELDDSYEATVVTYTTKSAEGRPVALPVMQRKRYIIVLLTVLSAVLLITIGSVLAVKLTHNQHTVHKHETLPPKSPSNTTSIPIFRRRNSEPGRIRRHEMVLKAVQQSQ